MFNDRHCSKAVKQAMNTAVALGNVSTRMVRRQVGKGNVLGIVCMKKVRKERREVERKVIRYHSATTKNRINRTSRLLTENTPGTVPKDL